MTVMLVVSVLGVGATQCRVQCDDARVGVSSVDSDVACSQSECGSKHLL